MKTSHPKNTTTHHNELIIKNLNYTYTNQAEPIHVLKNINAHFEEGKLYAIKGESGSGKTTLLSLISALDEIQDGDILFNDKSIKTIGYNNFRLHYVNIVFQSYNLIKYMNAVENVEIAIDFANASEKTKTTKADSRQKALACLAKVGLDASTSKRLINKLSGGQQQRVAIARALASNSPIIVADEPTGNLDEDTEEKIIKIFQDLAHKDHKIIIIVTHSRPVAAHADQILKLAKGALN